MSLIPYSLPGCGSSTGEHGIHRQPKLLSNTLEF